VNEGEPRGSLVPVGALGFAYFASIGLFGAYAPLWFQWLGFSTLAIGVIASLQAWTRVVVPYGWSWLGDHWQHGAVSVAAVVVVVFIANSGVVPLSEAAIAQRLTTAHGLDFRRYGRTRVWGSAGFILAVGLGGSLLQATGIDTLPGLAVGLFAAVAAAAWQFPRRAPAPADGHAVIDANVWRILRRPAVAWFFGGVFFIVLAHTSLNAFLSLYLDAAGYSKRAVGALWAVPVAVEIVFFWTQGHWFARWSAPTWMVIAAATTVLRFAAMAALGGSVPLLVATQSLHALTFAAQHAASISLVNQYFPGRLRGRGQALYSALGWGLSGVIGGVAGGAISQRWGFEALFAAAALVAMLAIVCCWRSRALMLRAGGPVYPAPHGQHSPANSSFG
jgi:MFS transporter, PPP family, 3-phenylpropionic acid transporter